MSNIKLSEYAKRMKVHYRTVYQWYAEGKIDNAFKTPGGSILVNLPENKEIQEKIVIYARVSSHEMKNNLERQIDRCKEYCYANGYQISNIYKEIGSGLNDNRKVLERILKDNSITKIVVENKDRFSRFGLNYIQLLLKNQGREIEIINQIDDNQEDLIKDMVSVLYSFSARMYGLRRIKNKKKIEKIIREDLYEDDP